MKVRRMHPARAVALGLVLLLIMGYGVRFLAAGLRDATHITGWILLTLLAFATLQNLRKKLTMIPLGAMAYWTRIHLLAGWLLMPMFVFHGGKWFPNGLADIVLAACFWVVIISGLLGLAWSRGFPHRLTRRGEEVLFERIPAHREAIRHEAEELILDLIRQTGSNTLGEFYDYRLRAFFSRACNFHEHLLDWNRSRFQLLGQMKGLERYLDAREMEVAKRLRALVERKDDLDYHAALQGGLKLWLWVHAPLTYALWALVFWHVMNVLGFQG